MKMKGRMNWRNARKKGTAPSDTANIFPKKGYQVSREIIDQETNRFLEKGGKIKLIVKVEESPYLYGHSSSCFIED